FFQAEDGIRDPLVTGVQTCALPIYDGSTDGTRELVASYGDQVRYLWQPNSGPATARNQGLSAASGEFVAFLDADDLWHPEKLERSEERRVGKEWRYRRSKRE